VWRYGAIATTKPKQDPGGSDLQGLLFGGLIEAMLDKIESILRDRCELDPSRPILVGVSGGPDSLCLTEILREAGYRLVIAHFNHKLRPESDAEADEVEKTAARLMIPSVVESGDVRLYASTEKLSIEEAARDLRYRFLFAQARRYEAQAVAVGHTADDQVETVLMHFIRGAGLAGLRGMSYRTFLPTFDATIPLVRPLLDVWREETIVYCASHGLNPHYDASNESFDFLRNRLRHALIPALETYNPRFRQAVWRSVQSLSSDHALLNEALAVWWEKCVIQETSDYVAFDLSCLSAYSDGLQRHLVRRAVERLLPGEETVYAVLERAANFIADPARVRMDLTGGLTFFREGQALYIIKPGAQLPFDHWPQMPAQSDSIPLTVPGQVDLSGGWCFSSERWRTPESAWEGASRNEDRFRVWLDAEGLPDRLQLRVKRPGDVFEPMGLQGHSQKLSDFFTNVKLPKRARDRWPLLCAGEEVIWVPGYHPAEAFRLRKTSRRVAYFALTRSPGKSGDK
jgi:tRNA(Ile)-lysidine synthase